MAETTNVQILVTARQAAAMLAVCEKQVLRMAGSGKLPFVPLGRLKRFCVTDLHKWIEENRTCSTTQVVSTSSPSGQKCLDGKPQ